MTVPLDCSSVVSNTHCAALCRRKLMTEWGRHWQSLNLTMLNASAEEPEAALAVSAGRPVLLEKSPTNIMMWSVAMVAAGDGDMSRS